MTGIVTTSLTLIDSSDRLLVIQDASAAVEVRLPASGAAGVSRPAGEPLGPGSRLLVTGVVGHPFGAPRLVASSVTWLGSDVEPRPLRIMAAPGPALEWRLVAVTGRLDVIHKLGLRWHAELIVGSIRIPVIGLTGARIAIGRLIIGRRVTIVGIVRRPYPSAIDQRFAIDVRSLADLAFASAGPVRRAPGQPTGSVGQGAGAAGEGATGDGNTGAGGSGAGPVSSAQPLVDLSELGSRPGQHVRVGGLVTRIDGAAVSIDDGTAIGRLLLTGDAAAYLDLVEVGDPLEATGVVASDGAGTYLLVSDPDGVSRAADPGAPGVPVAAATAQAGLIDQASPGAAPAGGSVPGRGTDGSTTGISIGLLQALAAGLIGAMIALLIALAGARLVARRTDRPAQPAGSGDGPRARPTLGPG